MDSPSLTLFSIAFALIVIGNTWAIVRLIRDADEVRILRRQTEETAHVIACIKAMMCKWAETWPDPTVREELLTIAKRFHDPPPSPAWTRSPPRYEPPERPVQMGMDFGLGGVIVRFLGE